MKARSSWIYYFASHPTAANLLMAIFVIFGLFNIGSMRRETFPDFAPTECEILVTYTGATAEQVEDAVCRRIEDALDNVSDVIEIRSEAREGKARVVAKMASGGDIQGFLNDVKTEVEAITDFPGETDPPVIRQIGKTDMVLSVAITGPMSLPHLKLFCEQVKNRMLKTDQISRVEVLGFSDHEIKIEIAAASLLQLGLTVADIAETIARQSINMPFGTIETRETEVLVRYADERRSIREFKDLIVKSGETGAELRLGDVAKITDRFELDEQKILFNQKRAGLLQVNKTKSQDALRIMHAVESFLERERQKAPAGVEFTITRNISKVISDRLNILVINALQGLILVFLTMWLFFSLRFSFWVAMGLPVSFLGTLFGMHLMDFSLNVFTMVGLLIAVGLLMDDAIVIAENIASHIQQGKPPLTAAVDGVIEVRAGVLSSFLTTIFIFGTLALLIEGDIGKVMWVMPVTLIFTLSVSLIEAFFILPNHLAHSLEGVDLNRPGRFHSWFEARVDNIKENVLGKAVDWAVSWRYLFTGLVFTAFLVSIAMLAGGILKTRAFPDIDGDVLEARILLPQGTPLWRTETIVGQVTDALRKINADYTPMQPGKQPLIQNVTTQFNQNLDTLETGSHVATVSADLLGAEERKTTLDEVANQWRKSVGMIPDVLNITYKEPVRGAGGLPIDIRLQGENLNQLKQASLDMMHWLNSYEGVQDLNDDLRPGKPEIQIKLRQGATALGIDALSVANQLRAAFQGKTAAEIQVGPESYEINVGLPLMDKDSVSDLENYHITTKSGSQIPLGTVANLSHDRGFGCIYRINSLRVITIQGDVNTKIANSNRIIFDTKTRFLPVFKERYPNIGVLLEGQAKEGKKTGASMRKSLLIGIFGIFVLLSFQFRSYVEPFAILLAIPLSFTGVVWGHLLMGLELSMPSIMGFVSLAGIVVNDSILLVAFIKRRLADGEDSATAAKNASRQRFRAILLTSLTTIMGLLPLLTERSLQAQILIPLAASIVFGLVASTVLVLLVIPAFYTILSDFKLIATTDMKQ